MITLGIEGTAHTVGVGILKDDKILANLTKMYIPKEGGIHPREAANHHADNLVPLLKQALALANVEIDDLDLVSFSMGPGLGPCLRTVATAARALSLKLKVPIIGANHCIAHLEIGKLLTGAEDPILVYLSGGNTQIISYKDGKYRVFGETLDIGIGNLLDKVAREFGLPFPGGPKIEKMALAGEKLYPLPYSVKGMDVSFSGLFTASMAYYKKGISQEDISKSVQETVFSMITEVTERALSHLNKDEILLGGGVARNRRVQEMLKIMAEDRGAHFYSPPGEVCIDNGAMIGYLGYLMYKSGIRMDIKDTEVDQKFRTDEVNVTWLKYSEHFKDYGTLPGAEAEILNTEFFGRKAIKKTRIVKNYRDKKLDLELRKERLKKEVRLLIETKKIGINVPIVYDIDLVEMSIVMEYIPGPTLREIFDNLSGSEKDQVADNLGMAVATLHNNKIVHGDLTTSNIIYYNNKLYFIDFSMGDKNAELEDFGVDLHLLKESFLSAHYKYYDYFGKIIESYQKYCNSSSEILDKLEEIEKRRRYS
ncbi:MAG: bifunctional N(6)-L-threonylcarbamoyladenine synthase/serine/threonine protein kinase [Thermoplasmata archaeon]